MGMLPIPTERGLNAEIIKQLKPIATAVYPDVLGPDPLQALNHEFLFKMIATVSKPLYENIGGPYTQLASKVEAVYNNPLSVFDLASVASIPSTLPTKDALEALIIAAVMPEAKKILDPPVLSKDPSHTNGGIKIFAELISGIAGGMVDLFVGTIKELIGCLTSLASLNISPPPKFPSASELTAALAGSLGPVASKILAGPVTSVPGNGQLPNIEKLIKLITGLAEGFTKILTKAFQALSDLIKEVQTKVEDKMDILKKLL